MKPPLSIIMPYYNDSDVAMATIRSLYKTIDVDKFELIVVNDGSDRDDRIPKEFIERYGIRHVSNFTNLGVGAAFDMGVSLARSENIFLIGSDLIFKKNGWAQRMFNVLQKHPKGLICAGCASTETKNVYYGADIVFYLTQDDVSESHPRKGKDGFASILEGKWRPRTGRGVYQVPCLMGAFYGVKRSWFNHLSGFDMHYKWGVLEPMISLKSWRMGGEVLVDTENSVSHIFNRKPNRKSLWDILIYNQLVTAVTAFGGFGAKYARFLESNGGTWNRGAEIYADKFSDIAFVAKHVDSNAVMTAEELEQHMIRLSYVYGLPDCSLIKP